MEALQSLDSLLFVGVNQTLSNPLTDFLMPLITNDWLLRIGFALALVIFLWRGSPRWRWAALGSVLALALADQLASSVFKPYFERIRPCQAPVLFENLRLLVNCGAGKSFPSSHAANAFAVSSFFIWISRRDACLKYMRWGLLSAATLVALSRVFVGVHYPADIIAGAALGSMCGVAIGLMVARYLPSAATAATAAAAENKTPANREP